MNSENEIERENLNRNGNVAISLDFEFPDRRTIDRNLESEDSLNEELHCDESNRQHENSNKFLLLKRFIFSFISAFHDWWICTSVIKKVKLLGFAVLPCLAIGLYIFHYTQNPGSLHNPLTILNPLTVVHPIIPSPFYSTIQFIKEKSNDLSNR